MDEMEEYEAYDDYKIKFNKGKIIGICILVVLVAIGVGIGFVFYPVPISYDMSKIVPVENDVVLLNKDSSLNSYDFPVLAKVRDGALVNEEFNIMFLTDAHICELQTPTKKTIDRIVKAVMREKPDLIILAGDTLNGLNDSRRVTNFADIMEKLNVYWAPVLGNHEGDRPQMMTTRKSLVEKWSKYDKCLIESGTKRTKAGEDVEGYGNYVVNVLGPSGKIASSFFLIDNGGKTNKTHQEKWGVSKKSDIAITENQVTWYRETYEDIAAANGGTLTHFCIIHKPLQEFAAAVQIDEDSIDKSDYSKILNWDITAEAAADGWEKVSGDFRDKAHCPPYTDGKLYDALVDCGAKAVLFGHDHVNTTMLYNRQADMYLGYIRLTSVKEHVYAAEGYNMMSINTHGVYTFVAKHPDGSFDEELFHN